MDLDLIAFLRFKLGDLLGNVSLEQDRVAPGDLIERPEATNFGRVLSAVAISSAGSVDFGQEPAKIS